MKFKLPENNILSLWWTVIINWLTQLGVFKIMPKKIFAYIIILLFLVVLLCITNLLFRSAEDVAEYQIHTMCTQCSHRAIMYIIDPDSGVCDKCNGKVGYAWQCDDCGKYFPKLNTEKILLADPKLSRMEKVALIKQPLCLHCNSSKVHYVSNDDATFGYK
jgi:hypothetical protein